MLTIDIIIFGQLLGCVKPFAQKVNFKVQASQSAALEFIVSKCPNLK